MRAIFNTAVTHWTKHLVLGAFGCGAYCNPPELVIEMFLQILNHVESKGLFSCVVFAVLDTKGR